MKRRQAEKIVKLFKRGRRAWSARTVDTAFLVDAQQRFREMILSFYGENRNWPTEIRMTFCVFEYDRHGTDLTASVRHQLATPLPA